MYQRHYVPLSYDLTTFQILGQKFSKKIVGILVQSTNQKIAPNDDTKRTF